MRHARSSARSNRSRDWSTSSRSSRACRRRAPCRPICTRCSTTRWRCIAACSRDVEIRHALRRVAAAGIGRSGADPPRDHQYRRQRDRGDGPPRRDRHRDPARRGEQSGADRRRDNGPGIPAAERDKLFLPYYSTKQRGSGLGLAIVRRIVAEHGGSIDVTDNVPRGTRFAIELPC